MPHSFNLRSDRNSLREQREKQKNLYFQMNSKSITLDRLTYHIIETLI